MAAFCSSLTHNCNYAYLCDAVTAWNKNILTSSRIKSVGKRERARCTARCTARFTFGLARKLLDYRNMTNQISITSQIMLFATEVHHSLITIDLLLSLTWPFSAHLSCTESQMQCAACLVHVLATFQERESSVINVAMLKA